VRTVVKCFGALSFVDPADVQEYFAILAQHASVVDVDLLGKHNNSRFQLD
jgi:hypothetical protein